MVKKKGDTIKDNKKEFLIFESRNEVLCSLIFSYIWQHYEVILEKIVLLEIYSQIKDSRCVRIQCLQESVYNVSLDSGLNAKRK